MGRRALSCSNLVRLLFFLTLMAFVKQVLSQKMALISHCLLEDLSRIQVKVPALIPT